MSETLPALQTVPHVELSRYLGRWYEICRLPIRFEDPEATDVTATYSLHEGKIRVDNRCFDEDGKPTQVVGEATAVDASNARLKVSFLPAPLRWLPFFQGDYCVLKLDLDYRTALVGEPGRKFLWLLAREPRVPDDVKASFLAEARRQGYDLTDLITCRHTGREVPATR